MNKLTELNAKDIEILSLFVAEECCELGNAYYNQAQLDEAIAEYKTAIRINPNLAGPHYNLGNIVLPIFWTIFGCY